MIFLRETSEYSKIRTLKKGCGFRIIRKGKEESYFLLPCLATAFILAAMAS